MRSLIAIALFASVVSGIPLNEAHATCVGSDSLSTCFDQSGNSYTVQRFGNMTIMNGFNAQTGSSWSQNSQTLGNMTFHNGTASNGNSWNSTQQHFGNGFSTYNGVDSRGNSFSRFCGPYGCN